MAATVSAWAKPGAWALDSEENEDELLQQGKEDAANAGGLNNKAANDAGLSDFPSLAAAAATKTKKKKPQILSLQEFSSYGSAKQPQSVGLTPEEIMALPTGPRERTAEELDRSRLGGGFRSYGSSYDRPAREESRRPRDSNRDFAPSRADETDDWGATKKFTAGNGFERRERGERGGFFSDSQSRADDSDNWAAKKAFVPSEGRRFERRGSFESNGGGGDSDNWSKKKEEEGWKSRSEGGAFDSLREKRRSNGTDSDSWAKKAEEGNGGGNPSRPRLNLQPRTLPLPEGQQNGNGNVNVIETIVKPKGSGSNPFGDARPREEVLKEKGQDWKEIDQKLESVKIKEVVDASSSFRKKGFGSSNGRSRSPEKSWRKPEGNDAPPRPSSSSAGEKQQPVDETGDAECGHNEQEN
ncbi:PREDICTED: eukaryotic translation initiation factor 4B3-like [Ipomoea nil]|uniref:eukaryotic translation initiation factor 4B3-like n=1 Tax=Ipomoea nil TaxID=35883 RepID=UPI0009014AFB|nr:PREDICTED: eukaryotic translation initiation factor 4B3-like [Ipomoea nil]